MRVPLQIVMQHLGAAERRIAHAIEGGLAQLKGRVEDFENAVALYRFGEDQGARVPKALADIEKIGLVARSQSWALFGARAGAVALADYCCIVAEIDDLLLHCPSIQPLLNSGIRDLSRELFARYFSVLSSNLADAEPAADGDPSPVLRGRDSTSSSKGKRLSSDPLGSVTLTSDAVINSTYAGVIGDKLITYEVSMPSVDALHDAIGLYWQFVLSAGREYILPFPLRD